MNTSTIYTIRYQGPEEGGGWYDVLRPYTPGINEFGRVMMQTADKAEAERVVAALNGVPKVVALCKRMQTLQPGVIGVGDVLLFIDEVLAALKS